MEFTKEEIETAKKIHSLYTKDFVESGVSKGFNNFADSLLKPETKFINVRIEYDAGKITFGMNDHAIRSILNCGCSDDKANWKVTELPEVFTREDIEELRKYKSWNVYGNLDGIINDWLSERKSK